MILPLTQRASNTDCTFSCNGSLTAIPLVPARPDGDDGVEGTLLHHLIAKRLVLELGAVEPEGGLTPPVLPTGYKLAAFSAWIVDWAVRLVAEQVPPGWSLMVEVPLAYRYELPRPLWVPVSEITGPIPPEFTVKDGKVLIDHFILSGHMDWFAISPDATECIKGDWKTGQIGAETADFNWQVGSYDGLAKMAWPTLNTSKFLLAQPRIDEEATGIERVSTSTLDGAQMDAMNAMLAEEMNKALENRFETDSSVKACKYCPVGWRCPSIKAEKQFMKATLTPEIIEELKAAPNDAQLGDFVVSARTLSGPIESAEELLHERIAAQGYVDAGCGRRITCKITAGSYTVTDPVAFMAATRTMLPADEQISRCFRPSMTALKDEIADALKIPKTSKVGMSAASEFDARLRPLTVQGERKTLIFT